MFQAIKNLFSKPKPWVYVEHTYIGVEGQCYTYTTLYKRGDETKHVTYRFHAHTTKKEKDHDKLVRFFTVEASQMR